MSRALQAALLSALVFPGAGHFFLKRPLAGIVLAGTALASLCFLSATALERTVQITEKIQAGEVGMDVVAITEFLLRRPAGIEAQFLNIAIAVLLFSWLISIGDSYRVGRGQVASRQ